MSVVHYTVSGVLTYTSTSPAKIISTITGGMFIDDQKKGNPDTTPGGIYHITAFDIDVAWTTKTWHFNNTTHSNYCRIVAASGGYEGPDYHGPIYWFGLETGTGEGRPLWYGMDHSGAMEWYKIHEPYNAKPINDIRTGNDCSEMNTLPPMIVMKNFHPNVEFSMPSDWPTPVKDYRGYTTAYLDMTIISDAWKDMIWSHDQAPGSPSGVRTKIVE